MMGNASLDEGDGSASLDRNFPIVLFVLFVPFVPFVPLIPSETLLTFHLFTFHLSPYEDCSSYT